MAKASAIVTASNGVTVCSRTSVFTEVIDCVPSPPDKTVSDALRSAASGVTGGTVLKASEIPEVWGNITDDDMQRVADRLALYGMPIVS